MKIKSPADVIATACKQLFARIDKLFNEGLGPWIALIGSSRSVRAPFFLVQQLLPVLGSGSSIIFVSSLAAPCRSRNIASLCGHQGGN